MLCGESCPIQIASYSFERSINEVDGSSDSRFFKATGCGSRNLKVSSCVETMSSIGFEASNTQVKPCD